MGVTSEHKVVKGLGEYQTLDGAAEALGLTYWGVRGLIRRHHIPTVKLGRSTLVKLSDLMGLQQEAITNQAVPSTARSTESRRDKRGK